MKYNKSFLLRKYKKFFQGFSFLEYKNSILIRKYKKFFNIKARKFHFTGMLEIFSWWVFFIFQDWAEKLYFPKYETFFRVSVSLNKKNFRAVSVSRNIRKCKKFFNIRARKFHVPESQISLFLLSMK